MDKETLSNYGWIVIAVLVLVVMIALATPFGSFISEAVQSTTKGLFDVNQSALNSTGLINIDNQEFDVPDMNHGAGENGETPVVPSEPETPVDPQPTLLKFGIDIYGREFTYEEGMTWGEWYESDYCDKSIFKLIDGTDPYIAVSERGIDAALLPDTFWGGVEYWDQDCLFGDEDITYYTDVDVLILPVTYIY